MRNPLTPLTNATHLLRAAIGGTPGEQGCSSR
jgi:hypothetical protein